jgi:hypothetical protein
MSPLSYVLLALAFIVGMVLALTRVRHLKLKAAATAAASSAYAAQIERPRLEITYSYAYPAFAVVFRNAELLQRAEQTGANEVFIQAIQGICGTRGSKARPFDARHAVGFRHDNILTRADIGIQ